MVKSIGSAGDSMGFNEQTFTEQGVTELANSRPPPSSGRTRSSMDASPVNSTAQLVEKQSTDKARNRALLRDNQIRKSAGLTLSKQGSTRSSLGNVARSPQKTNSDSPTALANFELREAETILESNTIVEAARHMAAKHLDFVLVIDVMERLVGIVTDRDLAFRVIADGLDPRQTTVAQVMTRDPQCVQSSMGVFEALEIMSKNHFRHLPVKEDGRVVGVLDIAKCLYDALQKLELADAAAHQIASALETVGKEFAQVIDKQTRNNDALNYADSLRDALSSPKLSSILSCEDDDDSLQGAPQCLVVNLKCTVLQAAKQLRERKETALVVTDEQGVALLGIFTTKDVLLRVVAAGLDANTTSIIRVMTPHPDAATPNTSIVAALRQMHSGNYLHLPVVSVRTKTIFGVVDVLQLTYAVLEQMYSLQERNEAPLWHQLWSPTVDGTSEPSTIQGSPSSHRQVAYISAPLSTGDDFCLLPSCVIFKIKLMGNEAAILLPAMNILELPTLSELEAEALMRFGATQGRLCLVDDENDLITIRDDAELGNFVNLVIAAGKDKLNLVLQDHDAKVTRDSQNEEKRMNSLESSEGLSLALVGGGLAILGASLAVAVLVLLRSQRS